MGSIPKSKALCITDAMDVLLKRTVDCTRLSPPLLICKYIVMIDTYYIINCLFPNTTLDFIEGSDLSIITNEVSNDKNDKNETLM